MADLMAMGDGLVGWRCVRTPDRFVEELAIIAAAYCSLSAMPCQEMILGLDSSVNLRYMLCGESRACHSKVDV